MTLNPNEFLDLIEEDNGKEKIIRFGRIAADHVSGRPQIVFDGTETPSVKRYPYAQSYTPTANDRVLMIKNVVIDKII